jgi:putative redox protein
MVRIRMRYEGGLRVRAVHDPSGTVLVSDAPVDNHGKGESFSPTDLVATALGTCILTLMGIAAERRGIPLEGAEVVVTKKMVSNPRRIGALETEVRIPGSFGPRDRRILEKAAAACPVERSLHPDVEIPIRFSWGAPDRLPAASEAGDGSS